MARRQLSESDIISEQFDRVIRLTKNLMYNDVNLKSGYYFEQYPRTYEYTGIILKEHQEYLVEKLEELKEYMIEFCAQEPAQQNAD